MNTHNVPLVLFDGVCNLCDETVQFLIKKDTNQKLYFAALQSQIGQKWLTHFGLSTQEFDTVYLIYEGKFYAKSDAILKAFELMGNHWSHLSYLKFLPLFFRNFVYNWISQNRYKLFGKKNECMIPTPEIRTRFLE